MLKAMRNREAAVAADPLQMAQCPSQNQETDAWKN
jgi:hypothetical protein